MKKISLGSFPLVDVQKSDRKTFESYLIKVVSDLITVNQISNSVQTDRVRYITPLSIMNFIKENKDKNLVQTDYEPDKKQSENIMKDKSKTIKNAFRNTKLLYQSMASDPFYKTNIFYPIYMEETIKNSYEYSDYNYDFLILANDLVKQQLLDEIQYDDRITLLFLVLKCLLVPNLRLNQIGVSGTHDGENFRKYFSVFLETCKNENINPFDMFIKLIKAAGKQKRKGMKNALGRLGARLTNEDVSNKYHSASFVNLFNTEGEIKDAKFLLNISLDTINNFVAEDPALDKNYNPMLRQYSQAKTHEYGKILSIIDALRAFNLEEHVVSNLTPSQNLTKVQVGNESLLLNIDGLINELELTYFRRFLEDLKRSELSTINAVRRTIKKKFNTDILTNFGPDNTREGVTKKLAQAEEIYNKAKADSVSLYNTARAFANGLGFADLKQIPGASWFTNQNDLAQYNQLNISMQQIIQTEQQALTAYQTEQNNLKTAPSSEEAIKSINDIALSLTVNLEILQAQLTTLYSEVYQYFYSETFKSDLSKIKSKSTNGRIDSAHLKAELFSTGTGTSEYLNSLKVTAEEIAGEFQNQIDFNLKNKIKDNFFNSGISSVIDISKDISDNINADIIIDNLISNIFTPVFIKYTNKAISESNQLKDLKSENNPLLRKILSEKNLFKAYILTSEVLVQAYELIHYIDTIKYEEGIINHPVSKVFNDVNKIQFMITRLGLDNHPVYIFHGDRVMLSMPGYLSLTGSPFISSVKTEEFMQFGKINWSQDLWNQEYMFGGAENSKKFSDIKANVERINGLIKKVSEDVKNAQGKEKAKLEQALKNHQTELKRQQEKLEELKKLSHGSNLTSNINYQKQTAYVPGQQVAPNNGYQQGPNQTQSYPKPGYNQHITPGGNYNYQMDNRGYNRNEQDTINNGRSQLDSLREQPLHGNSYQDQNQPNDFMNNPYIQNRMNNLHS